MEMGGGDFEDANQTGSTANGSAVEPVAVLSRAPVETFVPHIHSSSTKVTSKIIIDVEDDDDDDDDDDEVMVLDGDVGTSAKGKESISGFLVVISSITSGSSSLHVGPANNQNSPSHVVTPQKIIIDIDVEEEDDDYEFMVIDGDVGISAEEKESMSRFPVVTSSITTGESGLHVGPANNQSSASPMASASVRIDPEDVTEILQKYNVFKKLDIVEDYSDHYFSKSRCAKRIKYL